ncbi:response regulator [Chitinibacter fontanus]|uniref:Sensory/regulatory protein RpfC n=1 Tax=Chitinibacter fontanus TaxID=1737446 RepID=A0A7D5VAM1_9NEIS|nr:response regulator [Chitinibacter fontanus]QLI82377.1 response regulator [Chitinibacter fontanus]
MPFVAMKSITLRLRIAFLIVAATTLCAGLGALWVFRSVDQTYTNISHESYPATRAIAGLEKNALEVALALHLLSGADDEMSREDAFRQLNILLKQAPTHLSLLESLHSTENQALAAQYAQITKQAAETNQIVHDLIAIDKENRQIVQQVEQMRLGFEKKIDPLLHNAKEDLLLAAGKTSAQAGMQWARMNENEKAMRLGMNEIRAETFRLITLIATEGEEGFRRKGGENIDRLEKAIAQTEPEFRAEGMKMIKVLRSPMNNVGREASTAMMAFYRDTSRLTRKYQDEVNRSGDLITQDTTNAVVNLVNTQVQTLTASEQLKSSYYQLASSLRKMVWSANEAALKTDSDSFQRIYQNALVITQQINNPLFKKAQADSRAALVDLEQQHKQIIELTKRRIMLLQLLDRLAKENHNVTRALLDTTHALNSSVSGDLSGQVNTLDADIKQSTHLMMIATSVAILIALLVGWVYVSRSLGNRLERLASSMRSLSQGQLGEDLQVQGHDEVSDIELGVLQFRALLMQQREQTEALRLARDEAQAAVKMKSEFLANMSHEIRTPLTAILGYTNLVADHELNGIQRQYIGRAQNAAQMLLGVVNDVLDFSKIEANKLQIESSPFDLMQLFSQLAGTVAIQAQAKGLRLSFEITPEVPTWVVGDALRLGQVLLNLLNNAIKFTEQGDVNLHVRCVREDEQNIGLLFVVEDSGIGISQEAQSRLFSLFSQADSSTTRRFGGSGLGLAISQQLIQLMGGQIRVQSEVGFGSEFSFELSFLKYAQAEYRIDCVVPRRAVIADSSPDHALHLSQHLQFMGFDCVLLNNSAQLAAYLQSGHQIDLLLLEVKLCHGSEAQLCEQMQQLYATGLPMILLCYGLDDVEITQNSSLRDCPLLIKPLVPSLIRSVVSQTLKLDLPADLARNQALAEREALQGLRILLVEDTDLLLELGLTMLSNMGAQVTPVSSGNAAIAAVMSSHFDVVLMDVQMPEMDGRDTTRAIRALPGFDALPIIALTAHAMEGERELCLQAGMNDHLSKPIDAQKLKQVLQNYLPTGPQAVRSPQAVASEPERGLLPGAGIDFLTALQRMGSMKMLKKMLPRFIERFADSAQQLRVLIGNGQLADAERLAHTLKGVAGQVEALAVMHVAAQLERALHQGQTDLTPQISELERLLAEACSQITHWLELNPVDEVAVTH